MCFNMSVLEKGEHSELSPVYQLAVTTKTPYKGTSIIFREHNNHKIIINKTIGNPKTVLFQK